jgi:hypothetical protein
MGGHGLTMVRCPCPATFPCLSSLSRPALIAPSLRFRFFARWKKKRRRPIGSLPTPNLRCVLHLDIPRPNFGYIRNPDLHPVKHSGCSHSTGFWKDQPVRVFPIDQWRLSEMAKQSPRAGAEHDPRTVCPPTRPTTRNRIGRANISPRAKAHCPPPKPCSSATCIHDLRHHLSRSKPPQEIAAVDSQPALGRPTNPCSKGFWPVGSALGRAREQQSLLTRRCNLGRTLALQLAYC